jgi:cell division protein FtsB
MNSFRIAGILSQNQDKMLASQGQEKCARRVAGLDSCAHWWRPILGNGHKATYRNKRQGSSAISTFILPGPAKSICLAQIVGFLLQRLIIHPTPHHWFPPAKKGIAVIDVAEILALHEQTVALWHQQPIVNTYSNWLGIVCQQHIFNYELWHQEDIARSRDVTDAQIAEVKRAIDRLNQARNDHIERLDDWITEQLTLHSISPKPDARQNTETPGSAIDRLSIMALRLYHYEEQLLRNDVDQDHLERMKTRIALCRSQKHDLSVSLSELLNDIVAGSKRHKTYRQMKMYNDPSLNPYLYAASKARELLAAHGV